ncbi:transcriptional regulator, HxlR family [Cribrihabitans marinus]|uniref:Transcriptional regulator, HxlR family n=1 Tax=Cribrihabitans marinus TaxID=1227549 RepID=A0A1H7E4X8_9RHOB|nr:helix-turn-helix domain-containing protein [Cribrihabitans marinus]GGH41961.1 HxlR family transcriptional regulator [Cribrihabitans marinus]SEK08127.1 transcriptional regulator, HxlR family [Cribrihabitans marinus]
MKSYGQFCPIAKAAEIFCERWTALVIRNLGAGAQRFSDIHRGVPHMSATLLTRRLRQLEAEGLVERKRSDTGKSWTYHLTDAGAEFLPLVGALGIWGQRWTRRELSEGELDLGLLIWGLEYSVDPMAFGPERHVLRLDVSDQPEHKRFYWYVCEGGRLDLCVSDPGGGTDLFLEATLADLIRVYRGDVPLAAAMEDGRITVDGAPKLMRRLARWFNFDTMARTPPAAGGPVRRPASEPSKSR